MQRIVMTPENQELVATIDEMFAALGRNDGVRLEEILCPDFHAFENGVAMSGPELLGLMSELHAAGKCYRWSVRSPKIERQGSLGAVAYLNRGFISDTPDSEPVPTSWLETVLLRREAGRWRVAFLHSTRMKADGLPPAAPT